jgi:hypothetical protein
VKAATRRSPALIGYRNEWFKAVLQSGKIEIVVALGDAATEAWRFWKDTPAGAASTVAFAGIRHPTQPESTSKGVKVKLAAATKNLLANWNVALQALAPALMHPDQAVPLVPYGNAWADGDRVPIPEADLPEGLPPWMHEQDGWAKRAGADALAKRRNITITVPRGIVS